MSTTSVHASAPARVDCGNTWDLKALALPNEALQPTTVNIALDIRTAARLRPFDRGAISVVSEGFQNEAARADMVPFDTSLGLIFAIASHFNVSGVSIVIESEIPPKSGLGGSGVLAVSVIAALSTALSLAKRSSALPKQSVAVLAHQIEDGLRISNTGLQDQTAAVYGGIHKWTWQYSNYARPFKGEALLSRKQFPEVEKHMLIAYTGEARASSVMTSKWIRTFLRGETRKVWLDVKETTEEFAEALRNLNWLAASVAMKRETAIMVSLTPEVLSPIARKLVVAASALDCGARFTGAGQGGCVWALGEQSSIDQLRYEWDSILRSTKLGRLLVSRIAEEGLAVEYQSI